ncbi:MAG TPA: polyamine ABC transporter ATP-binding protein, partial [Delftia acidovorans]|nr:polyamine ABC transporter ATP-binding protein [Delftia acidovorans]
MIELKNVSKWYGSFQVLTDCSTNIQKGEVVVVCGPSGSGKSTLLRLIAGFNRHQRGELLVGGQDITGVPPHARNIGMVFQNY